MNIDNLKAKPYELECLHTIWLKHKPGLDDLLWCRSCNKYRPLNDNHKVGKYFDPNGEFWSEREKRNTFSGGCLYSGCTYTYTTKYGFEPLRERLHKHYMRTHTNFGAVTIREEPLRLPPGSPAPF